LRGLLDCNHIALRDNVNTHEARRSSANVKKMNLVQVIRGEDRRAGAVDGNRIRLLDNHPTIYSLATEAIASERTLTSLAEACAGSETLDYDAVYSGRSGWRLMAPFDHPDDAAHCLVSGTGLTHKASAENRAAMHKQANAGVTDSTRMYQFGLEGGYPPAGQIGVQPEWFYKGDGSILKAHRDDLWVPPYAEDGGEEPEIAGVYLISPSGEPCRVGLTIGNEFSDHCMERRNYLYLAPSKLRNCSIGPELAIGDLPFENVPGTVSVIRNDAPFWTKAIWTGQRNMSHSIANLEHHHFKYPDHRRPGDVHIHFFGADAFSFGDGIALQTGDVMEVSFPQFGRSLRNTIRIGAGPETMIAVRSL
jgi:hypothetical protein